MRTSLLLLTLIFTTSSMVVGEEMPTEREIQQLFLQIMQSLQQGLLVQKDSHGEVIYEGPLQLLLTEAHAGRSLEVPLLKVFPLMKNLETTIGKFYQGDALFDPYQFFLAKIAVSARFNELRMAVRIVNLHLARFNEYQLAHKDQDAAKELRQVLRYVTKIAELWQFPFREIYQRLR